MEAAEPSSMTSPGVPGGQLPAIFIQMGIFVFEHVLVSGTPTAHDFLVCLFPKALSFTERVSLDSKQPWSGGERLF